MKIPSVGPFISTLLNKVIFPGLPVSGRLIVILYLTTMVDEPIDTITTTRLTMANTYTKFYFHIVFAVKGKANLIAAEWKTELYKYMSGIINHEKQKPLIINGPSDHVHLLINTKPDCRLSDLIRDVKANSSRFINEKKWVAGRFEWQKGFGGFTVGYRRLDIIFDYIRDQEEHHRKKSFREEYIELLEKHGIEFDEKYLFEEI